MSMSIKHLWMIVISLTIALSGMGHTQADELGAGHPSARPESMPAARAADFLDSVGINVVVFDDRRHTEINLPRLEELGVRHIRVGLRAAETVDYRGDGPILLERIKDLGKHGYQVTGIFNCWHTMEQFEAVCEYLLPEGLYQVEGPNEPWHKQENFSWKGEGWPHGAKQFMEDMHSMIRGNPRLKHLPIVSFSGSTTRYGSIEHLVDFGNEHIYPAPGQAITSGDALAKKIERCRNTNYPNVPLQFTEMGYNSGEGKNPGYRPTSLSMQARGVPRLLLESYRHGLDRVFLYCLYARHDTGFSLLHRDGSPKPAFEAVRDMLRLLSDDRPDATTFDPQPLGLAITSRSDTVHHLLLQRSDGVWLLCLWNDVPGWDPKAKRDLKQERVPVTLKIAKAIQHIAAYEPLTRGTDAKKLSLTPDHALTIHIPDHPIILELTP